MTEAAETSPVFSPDGKWIAYAASDAPPTWGFTSRVHVVPVDGGPSRALAESYDRQPNIIGWSADGSKVFISETHRSVNRLSALPVDGGKPVDLSPADRMVDGPTLNRTGSHIGFSSQAADTPPEAFVSGVEPFGLSQISHVQDLPDTPVGKTEVVQWKSADGKDVEGLLTYPVGYETGTRVPLLVVVHGGPTGVFMQRFIASNTVYKSRGSSSML